MSDTKKVLLAFALGAVAGPAVVWGAALALVAWAAMLGGR